MAAGVSGLNHLTLAVADLDRSLAFYRDVLGFRVAAVWATGAYLEAGTLWLCLSVGPVTAREDYTHVALSVAEGDFAALAERVSAVMPQWRANVSEGASLYFLDPDGHRLELHVGTLESRLADYRGRMVPGMRIFD
jgi:catechol 2,3-dioxygenase-like lactoylglutathione lyase family enzyme